MSLKSWTSASVITLQGASYIYDSWLVLYLFCQIVYAFRTKAPQLVLWQCVKAAQFHLIFFFSKLQSWQLPEGLKFSLKSYVCFMCCPSHIMPVVNVSVFQRPPVKKSSLRARPFLSTLRSNGGNRVKKAQCLGKLDTNSNRERFSVCLKVWLVIDQGKLNFS